MKKHYLLIPVFLLFSCCLFAQNWWPVKTGETYHYRLPDSTHLTHSIRIDSVKAQNGDSIFYLNRILSTVIDFFGEPLTLYKQGQFLGQTMTIKPDGRIVFESYNDFFLSPNIVIYPNANLGDSWLAVVDGNITATVTSISEGFVFSIPDSIKTIKFSNGTSWVLSRQHGLISAPDFYLSNAMVTLSGLENEGLGDRLYQFEDFFDFNVGDVFEGGSSFSGKFGGELILSKTKILEKSTLPDGFQYRVEKRIKRTWSGWSSGISFVLDTAMIEFHSADYINLSSYNRELISTQGTPYLSNKFSFVTHFNGGLRIGTRSSNISFPDFCPVLQISEDPNSSAYNFDYALDCSGGWSDGDRYYEEFHPGLGRTVRFVAVIDNTFSEWLAGAVIQGDTVWGSVTPDWFFTQTKEPKTISEPLKIYPNPADDFAIIEVETPISSATIQILGPESRLIRTLKIERQDNTVKLDLAGLPTGVYFVLLQSETEIRRGKLLISALRRP